MNLVGKIFVVLIFVMSLFFMGLTVAVYATHKNWKDFVENPATGLNKQLEDAKNRTEDFKSRVGKFQNELAQEKIIKRDAVASLENALTGLQSQLALQDKALANERNAKDEAIATLKTTQENEGALRAEVVGLREQHRQAEEDRDKFFAEVVKLTDELHQMRNDYDMLRQRNFDLADQLTDAKRVLTKFDLEPVPAIYEDVPDRVESVVLEVGAEGLVEIKIGSDDGLLKGHRLDAYRQDGSAYLGRIEVIDTWPDRAVCKILPEFRRGLIQGGDIVSTKLR